MCLEALYDDFINNDLKTCLLKIQTNVIDSINSRKDHYNYSLFLMDYLKSIVNRRMYSDDIYFTFVEKVERLVKKALRKNGYHILGGTIYFSKAELYFDIFEEYWIVIPVVIGLICFLVFREYFI